MPPLNIVHYIPTIHLADGGVARAVLDWCTVFAQRGHNVTLLTFQGSEVPPTWIDDAPSLPRTILLPTGHSPPRRLDKDAIRLCTDALQTADVVHLHAPWLPGNRRVAGLARQFQVPYIVTVHGMLDDWSMHQKSLKKKLYMALAGSRFLDRAALVHCTADAELQQARKWFANPNTAVLPCLIDLEPFTQMPGPQLALELLPPDSRGKKKLLFIGRLHDKKGVDVLIRAAALLRDRGNDFTVLIAGTGEPDYTKHLNDLTAQLNLTDQIHFLGLITGKTKLSLYQSADLFVLPTQQENFGLVLAESLASGTTVLTTKGTDIWQEIQQAGGTIAERTPQAIAVAITPLLANKDDLNARGQKGRSWAFETLATEPLAQKYELLYQNVARFRGKFLP